MADETTNGGAAAQPATPQLKILGITDSARGAERLPTFGVLHERLSPFEPANRLAEQGIFVWHGNFYALPLTETLGLEPTGMVRIGLLHYNTEEEIERLAAALGRIV